MFEEVVGDRVREIAPLFSGFDYSLSVRAAIEGGNPGRFFVDNTEHPRTGLALTIEGYLLAGEHDDTAIRAGLRALLRDRLFTGEVCVYRNDSLTLAVHPASWSALLPELIPSHEPEVQERYHYLCSELHDDWRSRLPEGYAVRRIDRALMADPNVVLGKGFGAWEEIETCWGSVDRFLERGVGYCVLHGERVVSRCAADCATADQIDIGIYTDPDHRRRGMGAIAAGATVEACLQQGWHRVGWHCDADNVASWKTAEKVGFRRNRTYQYYFYVFDLLDHWAELGWAHYRKGEYTLAAARYEQVFAKRQENPDYYYHVAALANAELDDAGRALRYLNAAVDAGWRHPDFTERQEAFRLLHGRPEWAQLLARMRE